MKSRIKDRWMTTGAVMLMGLGGVSLPGCGVNGVNSRLPAGGDQLIIITSTSTSTSTSIITSTHASTHTVQQYWDSVCTTDTDCEMHARMGTKHKEAPPRWKVWTAIGFAVIATGYLYARKQAQGADQRGVDVYTPGVNCDVAGRPGLGCAQ